MSEDGPEETPVSSPRMPVPRGQGYGWIRGSIARPMILVRPRCTVERTFAHILRKSSKLVAWSVGNVWTSVSGYKPYATARENTHSLSPHSTRGSPASSDVALYIKRSLVIILLENEAIYCPCDPSVCVFSLLCLIHLFLRAPSW